MKSRRTQKKPNLIGKPLGLSQENPAGDICHACHFIEVTTGYGTDLEELDGSWVPPSSEEPPLAFSPREQSKAAKPMRSLGRSNTTSLSPPDSGRLIIGGANATVTSERTAGAPLCPVIQLCGFLPFKHFS